MSIISLLKRNIGTWDQSRTWINEDFKKIEAFLNAIPDQVDHTAPRLDTVISSPAPAINADTTDIYTITQLAEPIQSFSMNLQGTPVEGQRLVIRILDNATPRAITWGSSFASRGATLPTTTTASTYLYVFLITTVCYGIKSTKTTTK